MLRKWAEHAPWELLQQAARCDDRRLIAQRGDPIVSSCGLRADETVGLMKVVWPKDRPTPDNPRNSRGGSGRLFARSGIRALPRAARIVQAPSGGALEQKRKRAWRLRTVGFNMCDVLSDVSLCLHRSFVRGLGGETTRYTSSLAATAHSSVAKRTDCCLKRTSAPTYICRAPVVAEPCACRMHGSSCCCCYRGWR